MKTKQALNPYLPSYEYVPDGEPYIFGDRIYVYGSHDRFGGSAYCMNDYVCWSAPVDDPGNWYFEGVIYKKSQDPRNPLGVMKLWAPDLAVGPDGRYYLYYSFEFTGVIGVAVADSPRGPFHFYGHVRLSNGHVIGTHPRDKYLFDPAVLVDDDGRVFLYAGLGVDRLGMALFPMGKECRGCYVTQLEPDMLTAKETPRLLLPKRGCAAGTCFEGHEYFEAPSIRKIGPLYYLVYSSCNGHELCYATSSYPDRDYRYGGTIVSNADIFPGVQEEAQNYYGNNHGGMVCIKNQWYIFYHRQTNRHDHSRQGCAEPIVILEDGSIPQVRISSCGLNGGPLAGNGTYPAYIACLLRSRNGVYRYGDRQKPARNHPYLTQEGGDRDTGPNQYIANLRDGATAGYREFSFCGQTQISVSVRGTAGGYIELRKEDGGEIIGILKPEPSDQWKEATAALDEPLLGVSDLYFTYVGGGYLDMNGFTIG